MRLPKRLSLLFLSVLGLSALGVAQQLQVEIGTSRSAGDLFDKADQVARNFNKNLATLTKQNRTQRAKAGRYNANLPISFPMTIWLTANGKRLPFDTSRVTRSPGLTLVFDSSGANAFDSATQTYLQSVYNAAQPLMDALFGPPAVNGNVAVKRYDSIEGTRDFVTGGYYVPNAPGGPEIRTPDYGSDRREVAAVNFIHCLLLAYLGPNQYTYDAFNEGLVRAVTMKIARTSSARPAGLDPDLIEGVIDASYDVDGFYDWYNQRALGGSHFIAPNLRDLQLPDSGSVGGLYLLRYRMAGAAWSKVLAEYPSFAATFNASFYSNSSIAGNVPALVALGQTTLNTFGGSNSTIEGQSFANWFVRQYILETNDTQGQKLLVEPIPATPLNSNDYGVFIVQANLFQTDAGGNETLLSGTSYPIFWDSALTPNRQFSTSGQDDKMDIAGGYGSVGPNLADLGQGPYRVALDVPVNDQLERVYLPAGAIQTASDSTAKDFYGTIVGENAQVGDTYRLQVTVNGTPITDVPITDNAFGVTIGTPTYLATAKLVVNVVRNRGGSDTTLMTRKVNKTPGPLALDLRINSEATYQFPASLPRGIALVGFPVDPFASLNSSVLGIADNQVLAARYDSSKAKYVLYPELEPFKIGHGYFIRSETAVNPFTVAGRVYTNTAASVALKPGWNMICSPLTTTVATTNVRIVKTTGFPAFWSDELGVDIGTDFFAFTPGSNDAASGAPETGTLAPATSFEPGKAYFVRVLAPEGLTLNFALNGGSGASTLRSVSSKAVSAVGWQMAVDLTYNRTSKARAIIGQSNTATRSFDPKEDSGMPPGIGGFQVIVENYEALYRDIRPVGTETYLLHLQGLTKGKTTTLGFSMLKGTVGTFTLKDSKGKSLGTMRPGFAYTFFPKSSDEYYQVVIGGSK